MGTATINISIPDSMKAHVEEIVANDGYGNTSEFFRELVRDYLKKREQRLLETLLLEGLQSGQSTPLTRSDFEEIKQRGIKQLAAKKRR
jgi:antitoxin ParD1/3/4